jgi:bleomycin hydrolase
MVAVIDAMVKTYVDNPGRKLSKKWRPAVDAVLTTYIGANPSNFTYEGKTYTPASFRDELKIVAADYVTITSFNHAPFYSEFILNIPDNWSYGSFYNVPLDEMISSIDNALENGYTVELDCDVSERTFSSKDGVAVIPKNSTNNKLALQGVYPEKKITQQYRQDEFENYNTTDDHLMHITGMLVDQNGTIYYKVKNSWGSDSTRVARDGYIYMSEADMRLKKISVMINKDSVPQELQNKLF